MTHEADSYIKLPEQLVTSMDLARTIRELEKLDDALHQNSLRKPGEATRLPKTSATLEELARLNNVSLLDSKQRRQLINLAKALQEYSPRIHISLAAEPSGRFVQKIAAWFRSNVHPTVLLEVGLRPTLAAGCVIRTNNKVFDLSLRKHFENQRALLAQAMRSSR